MSNALALIRALLIYGLCLPLAILLGYLLAIPMDQTSFTLIALLVALPLVPVLLRWHHPALIASWNTSAILFFLPGRPSLWLVLAVVSLVISVLQYILNRNLRFLAAPQMVWPLIFLAAVTVFTAEVTGGIGFRVFGGEAYGGKRYLLVLGAILGFFALTSRAIRPERAAVAVAIFFLGGLTLVVASLGSVLHPGLHFIFHFFPPESTESLLGEAGSRYVRLGAASFGCVAGLSFLLARHGLRGVLGLNERWRFFPLQVRGGPGLHQPWRTLVCLGFLWVALHGGFRSIAIFLGLAVFFQAWFEGMFSSRRLPVLALGAVLAGAVLLLFVDRLPLPVQRSLAFLPLPLDPVIQYDAQGSTEWRVSMWQRLWPEVPKYLLLGKGYGINAAEMEMVSSPSFARWTDTTDKWLLGGEYHNGPLSLLIPLGLPGALGFVWFLLAGGRVLQRNLRHGDPRLHTINSFLFACFIARAVSFFAVFGSFYTDLQLFVGLIALSVSLNGGVRGPLPATSPAVSPQLWRPPRPVRRLGGVPG